MTNTNKAQDQEAFDNAFGDMLKEKKPTEPTSILPATQGTLQDALFGPDDSEGTPATEEEILRFSEDFVPETPIDPDWEAHASREPIPLLSREQEARAISIGLQEIAKMKEYTLFNYRHLTNEYTRVYATFPLLFSKDYDTIFGEAHKKIAYVKDDIEHLIAGDYDNIEAVKNDFTLVQAYEERRLKLLHDILAFYNR